MTLMDLKEKIDQLLAQDEYRAGAIVTLGDDMLVLKAAGMVRSKSGLIVVNLNAKPVVDLS